MRPTLAGKFDEDKLRLPCYASPKLDGIRALPTPGGVMSRSWKKLPNLATQARFTCPEIFGYDGELIVGDPRDKDCYRKTSSAIMSADGEPDATLFVFDKVTTGGWRDRFIQLTGWDHVIILEHRLINTLDELYRYEEACIKEGFEGVMLRAPMGHYKEGRSTTKEGILLKMKRFQDSEALVLDVVELMHNENEKEIDERGYTKRSSHKENKVTSGVMGTLVVKDLVTGVEFEIGTGFTAAEREALWAEPPVGKIVKYKFFPVGVKDKPRHPVFMGFRAPEDM